MRKALHGTALLLALGLACACGSEDPGSTDDAGAAGAGGALPAGDLLPWQEGNSWTYQVTAVDGTVSEKTTTIGAEETVGGTGPHAAERANKVLTTKRNGTDETISWQAKNGEKVVRYREQSFAPNSELLELEEHWDPHKLHIDGSAEHTAATASWLEQYSETKIQYYSDGTAAAPTTSEQSDTWQVESVKTSVTVPAGTFEATVFLKLPTGKRYFYVPGVGKVKEEGGLLEELVSYEVQP